MAKSVIRIAIIGYGVEGRAAYRYWSARPETEITICDINQNCQIPLGAQAHLGPDYLRDLDQFDLIVRSPGTRLRDIKTTKPITSVITSVTREFFKVCPAPIIGVTGSKGKGTTSSLIYSILKAAGKKAFLGGNIGKPALDLLPDITDDSWVVLELSSFQLQDLSVSPRVAVHLMLVPDHLDHHLDFKEYKQAKQQIFINQTPTDTAVWAADYPEVEEAATKSVAQRRISYSQNGRQSVKHPQVYIESNQIMVEDGSDNKPQAIMKVADAPLLGKHNLDNVMAAIAATWDIVNSDNKANTAISSGVKSFIGLPHRLQLVREINGIKYIDDSISTNPSTAIAAIKAFHEPKHLILGGSDKGLDMSDLVDELFKSQSTIASILFIGQTGKDLRKLCLQAGLLATKLHLCQTLEVAMQLVRQAAKPGDVVLLSPAYASFDQFNNYASRGEKFAALAKIKAEL